VADGFLGGLAKPTIVPTRSHDTRTAVNAQMYEPYTSNNPAINRGLKELVIVVSGLNKLLMAPK
jgi:hypothetical protein